MKEGESISPSRASLPEDQLADRRASVCMHSHERERLRFLIFCVGEVNGKTSVTVSQPASATPFPLDPRNRPSCCDGLAFLTA